MEQWKLKIQVMDESNAEDQGPKKCGHSSLENVKWCSYNKLHENANPRAQVFATRLQLKRVKQWGLDPEVY